VHKKTEIENDQYDLMKVTVCILSFKRPQYLSEAIESVLDQTKPPTEIIIFDNGSGEEVEKVADRYKDEGVFFETSDIPKNIESNFERAFNRPRNKYFNIMHDDDRMCPDFLEKQVGYLENHPDIAGIFCNCHLIDSFGNRNGILRPYAMNTTFKSSAEVAFVYARGSCLPYPTGVYRTKEVRQVSIRKEYGKVSDVVFMCDLADRKAIAYQKLPLYEYRIHSEQDSARWSPDLLAMRDKFILAKIRNTPQRFIRLRYYVYKLHTILKKISALKQANLRCIDRS